MHVAMFSWESLHSIAVGGVAAHVMGRNGRIAVETAFTWDKLAALTLRCYES